MSQVKPPRDLVPQLAGLCVAAVLLGGLAYAFAGPAARMVAGPLQEVWVTIVRPSTAAVAPAIKPR